MATLLLSAAGSAIGAGIGGTFLGVSGAVIGQAAGATLGRMIDGRLLGAGADPVEMGRVDRFRVMGASQGAAIAQVFGRMRVGGQVIWASRFLEHAAKEGGGKGSPSPSTVTYSYSVSLAVALCVGPISAIGRIWADGVEIAPDDLNLRLYKGDETQAPDPKITAIEGVENTPAYRGMAYVVIEDLALAPYGNRVPQLSFEVIKPAVNTPFQDPAQTVKGVALIPGTGEYALAKTPVYFGASDFADSTSNCHTALDKSDFMASVDQLSADLPQARAVSLVVSWFGNDLRCGRCDIMPKVEDSAREGLPMTWRAGGITRMAAQEVPRLDGRSVYGGTPADDAVIEAIQTLRGSGREVMFYPFILMDQLEGNGLPDPWSGAADQPALPWRGRITLDKAPTMAGTTDRTTAATQEVNAFFGTAKATDFTVSADKIFYNGPDEWRYRRFVLHYAHLCVLAGGVDAFCIGSEMRGLTQIRRGSNQFPAVEALRQLARDVRAVLGPDVKISYAADWSEYFGYHTGNNVYFHLDPLWADPDINFVGIDNYMPLSDWREGDDHLDAAFGSIYNLDYLKANIAGGEGFDWYYKDDTDRQRQTRTPITDGAHQTPWVFRYKDIRSWWQEAHYNRINGVKQAAATPWQPMSKPIWFTEYGCAAIDKGTNQPNKFLDPKSSESSLPYFSNGRRDDNMQMSYLMAMAAYWGNSGNNPVSPNYNGRMLDMDHAFVWTWDARPFPAFPALRDVWSDGDNYDRGHWLNGRISGQSLAAVVSRLCAQAGVVDIDVGDLHGIVRGYRVAQAGTIRAALQPLMMAYGFDAFEQNGKVCFKMRRNRTAHELDPGALARHSDLETGHELRRSPQGDDAGQVLLGYVEAEGDYETAIAQAKPIEHDLRSLSQTDLDLALLRPEARQITQRWLAESRIARSSARFALPFSKAWLKVGDHVLIKGLPYRIDTIEWGDALLCEGTCIDPLLYHLPAPDHEPVSIASPAPALPLYPVFMDLPLISGDELPHAPHLAVGAASWAGTAAVWAAPQDAGYALNRLVDRGAVMGRTLNDFAMGQVALWDNGPPLLVQMAGGNLSSAGDMAVLGGANLMAIGIAGSDQWEVFQYARADLVAPRRYALSRRLRGLCGSDGLMRIWPAGTQVVALDAGIVQLNLPAALRGVMQHYRIGRAARGYDGAQAVHQAHAFQGAGLRPYAPVHLHARQIGGDMIFSWIRRSRFDGDQWDSADIPLGEESERYIIKLWNGSALLREAQSTAPEWTYPAALRAADGVAGHITIAQLSPRYGAGLPAVYVL